MDFSTRMPPEPPEVTKKKAEKDAARKKAAKEKKRKKQAEESADKRSKEKALAYAKEVNSSHQRIMAKEISKYLRYYSSHKSASPTRNYTNIYNQNGTDAAKTRSTLLSVLGMENFIGLGTAKLSSLVPKIRLFKVSNKGQVEIKFDEHQTPVSITSNRSMRGSGAGIKSVSIDMEGDSPVTASRQFMVKIKLYFSSLDEIFKDRGGYDYADLFKLPESKRDAEQAKQGSTREEYSTRIRMEYGYSDPHYDSINWTKTELKVIRQARRIITLGNIGHSIEYNENGSVSVDLEYIGYIEKESLKLDVLRISMTPSERQILADLEKNITASPPKTGSQNPTPPSNDKTQDSADRKAAAEIRTEGYQAFLKNITESRKVYRVKVQKYSKYSTVEEQQKYGILGTPSGSLSPLADKEQPRLKSGEKIISFFYLGDLLDEVVALAKEHDVLKGRYEFAFGSFVFKELDGKTIEVPISSVPVSTEAFGKWFKEHVIKKGERTTYDLFSFINDVLNAFVTETFSPKFQSTSYGLRVESAPIMRSQTFNTTKFVPIGDHKPSSFKNILNVGGEKKGSANYIFYYGENLMAEQDAYTGKPSTDAQNGIYWLLGGAEKGITKRIKYSKEEQKYLREARMTQQGINDKKKILHNLYRANIELVGNPIFKPGMVVYVAPLSLSPQSAEDIGLSGYFQVLKVGNSIEDGKYQTDIEALWIRPRVKGRSR